MSLGAVRLSLLGVALALIAGCGGGSGMSGGGGNGGSGGGGNGGGGGSSDTAVVIQFSDPAPTLVAAKIGSGSYAAETLAAGKISITVPSGTTTYSVAYLCPPRISDNVTIGVEELQFESVLDGTTVNLGCPQQAGPQDTLTGTIDASAFPAAESMIISTRSSTSAGEGLVVPAGGAFQVSGPTGTDRALVALYDSDQINFSANLIAIKNFDNQAVPGALNAGNPVVFGAGDAAIQAPITFANIPTGFSATPRVWVWLDDELIPITSGVVSQYAQLPAGMMKTGDYYSFLATSSSGSQTTETVGAEAYPTAGGPVSLSFPAPWSSSGPSAAALPTFKLDYTGFAGDAKAYAQAQLDWASGADAGGNLQITATQNYLSSTTSITVPDLSGVNGFLAPPARGTIVGWMEIFVNPVLPLKTSPAGGTDNYAMVQGNYSVP